ncbi:benzoate membrane transport protein [Neomicrococcus aestuarii]|uniref:Benzoate membrane transport protein n=1 Tax=Neomicrococcus aestuarii TaxID=556325 RepID=A0A7W8TVU3_9MICC|nr:benzoate/H(+) symporter BenE family transporter [Neomicrococcus aestuarii]MBB5513834.1 benzoate membrane transport protein [Neomicrococcus aestuarii]
MSSVSTSRWSQPILAGVITALVGYLSSFAVVLSGLQAVGANQAQAASGLLALILTQAVCGVVLSWITRMPITTAWSTPGSALLVGAGGAQFGWNEAVGAFLVSGALIMLTGLIPPLGRLIAAIPEKIAQAMLAGVLLQLCLVPFTALGTIPQFVGPVLVVWLVVLAFAPRWSVPAAMAVALGIAVVSVAMKDDAAGSLTLLPHLEWVVPQFSWGAITGIALPLFIVTMASQNVPGMAVLKSFGYNAPWSASMIATGAGSVAGSFAGGHAINLAAISAALAAGDEAGPDPARRWIAGVSSGVSYILLGLVSGAIVAISAGSPEGLIPAAAGLALLGTLGSSAASAFSDPQQRLSALLTFLIAASGLTVAGLGAAFWALVGGLVVRTLIERRV